MIGLLIKDYYTIRKYGVFLLAMGVLYAGIGSVNSMHSPVLFSVFLFLYMGVLTGSVINLEEKSHWEEYAVMLPYSRNKLVAEKYVLSLLNIGVASLIYLVLNLILMAMGMNRMILEDVLYMMLIGASVGLLLPAISLPWMFWLGGTKGRICMIVSVGIIVCVLGGFSMIGTESGAQMWMNQGWQFGIVLAAGALAVLGLSMLISMAVYARREL